MELLWEALRPLWLKKTGWQRNEAVANSFNTRQKVDKETKIWEIKQNAAFVTQKNNR